MDACGRDAAVPETLGADRPRFVERGGGCRYHPKPLQHLQLWGREEARAHDDQLVGWEKQFHWQRLLGGWLRVCRDCVRVLPPGGIQTSRAWRPCLL